MGGRQEFAYWHRCWSWNKHRLTITLALELNLGTDFLPNNTNYEASI